MGNKAKVGKATAGLIALLLLAAVPQGGCGGSFFSVAGSSSSDNGGGGGGGGASGGVGFAYVTNFDGNISEFKLSSANGALSLIGTISGGPADGPVGIAAHPSNNFLYVVNFADDLVHEYSVNTTTGQLAVLGTVSTGAGGGPSGIAVTPSGSYAYVTNQSSGSIAQYSIASNGTLTLIGTLSGLNAPQGVAANSSYVFVAESGAGTVDSFSIGTTGLLTLIGNTPVEGITSGTPSQVLLNPSQGILYASDSENGAVAVFTIGTGGVLSFDGNSSTGTASDAPIGLAISSGRNNFYSANFSADTSNRVRSPKRDAPGYDRDRHGPQRADRHRGQFRRQPGLCNQPGQWHRGRIQRQRLQRLAGFHRLGAYGEQRQQRQHP